MPNADERTWISPVQKVLELQTRVERLEEALREIADSQGLDFFSAPEVARAALEEK